jgi:hypothetical protein
MHAAPAAQPSASRVTVALMVLWPAFLMAGVAEMMVFAVVDPESLSWFGNDLIGWSRQAVYTVTFFIFWGVIATSGAITALLEAPPGD